jgi:hypothetical protein
METSDSATIQLIARLTFIEEQLRKQTQATERILNILIGDGEGHRGVVNRLAAVEAWQAMAGRVAMLFCTLILSAVFGLLWAIFQGRVELVFK